MSRLERFLIQITVFLIPTNLAYHWYTQQAYVNGSLVDYLLPKLYLSDLPILVLLIIWLYRSRSSFHKLKLFVVNHWLLVILFSYLFFTSLCSPRPLPAIWFWAKLLELTLFGLYLWHSVPHQRFPNLIRSPFVLAFTFQSIIGLLQYIKQSSLIGYIFFGETHLAFTSAVAKDAFSGALKILPYGTTPHPNVLAGFLAVCTLFLITHPQHYPKDFLKNIISFIVICLGLITFTLTQSQAASYSLILLTGIYLIWHQSKMMLKTPLTSLGKYSNYIIIVIIGLSIYHSYGSIDNTSIDRRYRLFSTALQSLSQHPLIGVGLNQSIITATKHGLITTPAPFMQPVHNIYLLWIVETGFMGLLLLYLVIRHHLPPLQKRRFMPYALPLIFILIIGLTDHYPLTLQTGQLLLLFSYLLARTSANHLK